LSEEYVKIYYRSDPMKYGLAEGRKKKKTVHLSFPPEGGRAAEAFSLFSHTDGKIRDGYGEDGCGRKVVGTERLILTQHSPYL
jgi:hypothetical protein